MRHVIIALKQVLRQLHREDEAKLLKLPRHPDSRVVIYSVAEIEAMIAGCRNIRERLLILILAETGARRGELYNMRVKDVQFDQYSAIIWFHGKTGTRPRRVYHSMKDITRYLAQHPAGDNAEAKFWINNQGAPLAYQGIYKIVHRIGYRSLHRNIYPHAFRHSACTRDAKKYTDQEMMVRFGWKSSDMVQVYAHLSNRDVDQKDLALHGFSREDRLLIEVPDMEGAPE
jgi:integrase